jgi:hypothetical protein
MFQLCTAVANVAFRFRRVVDKANVRFVVHYNLSKSLEAFYQVGGGARLVCARRFDDTHNNAGGYGLLGAGVGSSWTRWQSSTAHAMLIVFNTLQSLLLLLLCTGVMEYRVCVARRHRNAGRSVCSIARLMGPLDCWRNLTRVPTNQHIKQSNVEISDIEIGTRRRRVATTQCRTERRGSA